MTPVNRRIAVVLTAALAVALMAGPAHAAKQQIGPRVKVEGTRLPAPDPETFGTADDSAIGATPPTLAGEGFNERPVTIAPSDAPRIVIFLAHWCPHCQAEVPVIVKLAQQGALDGIEIDTISTNASEDYPNYPPSKWLKREKWPFKPVLVDDARARALEAFGGTSFPYLVFVASDGSVTGRWSGELEASSLEEIANRLLAGEPLFD
jgi:thiol-disulfide isomerase/thioredoxin